MTVRVEDLDQNLREINIRKADRVRDEACDLRLKADALDAHAASIERIWQIPPRCHLCGRRTCNH